MRLEKKIFRMFFIISIVSVLTVSIAILLELMGSKLYISEKQKESSKNLYSEGVSILTDTDKEFATAITESYSNSVNNKLHENQNEVQTICQYLKDMYSGNSGRVSKYSDKFVILMPGVSFANVNSEFQKIKSTRDIMMNILSDDSSTGDLFYVSATGMHISTRYLSDDVMFDASVDLRTREWYTEAVKIDGIYWSSVYNDTFTGLPTFTCSRDIYDDNGNLLGVAAKDILAEEVCKDILDSNTDMIKYSFILNAKGDFLLDSDTDLYTDDLLDKETISQDSYNTLHSTMIDKNNGAVVTSDMVAGFFTVKHIGWKIGVLLNYEKITGPVNHFSDMIENFGISSIRIFNTQIIWAIVSIIIIILIAAFVLVFMSSKFSKTITNPIEALNNGVKQIARGDLSYTVRVDSKDELEDLAESVNMMSSDLKKYMQSLKTVTAEKEKIHTELSVAKHIQKSMLPYIYPAFPDISSMDVYATMDPAKEVGGDFYDFFMVDDSHIAFVIADVSGKGVPAALFMVIAKTMIKNYAQTKNSPEAVFNNVNDKLCEGNEESMFVTAFMGVLDINTGEFVYVNAGHNPPLLKRNGKDFEYMDMRKGFVLAGMEDLKYHQQSLTLYKGDVIYMYTDGVVEAQNNFGELYSENRLKNYLNSIDAENMPIQKILKSVRKDVDEFVAGAAQFDDITMLVLKRN